MLDCDSTLQSPNSFQVSVGNRFAVVKEPVQPFERNVAIHFFEHIQKASDAFIVRSVQTERPFVG